MEKYIFEQPKGREDLKDELKEVNSGEHHITNLYDEHEDPSGDKIDLATGKSWSSSSVSMDAITMEDMGRDVIDGKELFSKDRELIGDEADKWLQENDPQYAFSDETEDAL